MPLPPQHTQQRSQSLPKPQPLTRIGVELHSFLREYPYKPYAHYRPLLTNRKGLEQYFISHFEATTQAPHCQVLRHATSGQTIGLVSWSHLPWDSTQLGVPAAKVDLLAASGDYAQQRAIKSALLAAILEDCRKEGIQHLSARVQSEDLSSIHALEHQGFVLLDGILTYSLASRHLTTPAPIPGIDIRLSHPADIAQIKEIARSSFVYDRFHSDPRIPAAAADDLHAAWAENACLGRAADAVIVAATGDEVLGFVTCKVDLHTSKYLGLTIGTIVLVATTEKARGCGVAKAATSGALQWFQTHGVDLVEVGTQIRNTAACRLYESCGFRLVTSSLSFRKWYGNSIEKGGDR